MANTYHKIYLQAVFAVKYRQALIRPEWKKDLFAVIGNLINETGCQTIGVNGVEDHVHCLFSLKPVVSVSEVMQIAKGKSSKFINESGLLDTRFEWQSGYGIFSYHESAIPNLKKYLDNQEEHHKKQKFLAEYQKLLKKFKVEYDPVYIFTEPV